MSKIFEAYKMNSEKSSRESGKIVPKSLPLFPEPKGTQVGDFNNLAQRAFSLQAGNQGSVLFLGSTTSGEGASFVSYNLAVALAREYDQKVVWIDANFVSPQKAIDRKGEISFCEILKDPGLVEKVQSEYNPCVIPGGRDLVSSRGLVVTEKYQEALLRLSKRFDFVVVDLPPILNASETGAMAKGGIGFILVIEQRYLKWEIIEHGVKLLQDKGVQVLGSVINRRDFPLPKVIYDRL